MDPNFMTTHQKGVKDKDNSNLNLNQMDLFLIENETVYIIMY